MLQSLSVIAGALCILSAFAAVPPAAPQLSPSLTEYQRTELLREGDASRGERLFHQDPRLNCFQCHTTDGSAAKAGPDLSTAGDKFTRRELIDAVLHPSGSIAVGYSTTTIHTRSGDDFSGIIKDASDAAVELMGADGQRNRIPRSEIELQQTSDISLMPEGLQAGLSLPEFTDLIEYLVSLKEPASSRQISHGMPAEIESLAAPVPLEPWLPESIRFQHPVWFGPVPGESNVFMIVEHESGKIWRLDAAGGQTNKTVFLDTGEFQKGTRGLLGMVMHPAFQTNRRYFIAKHGVQNGRFATRIFEYEAAPDLKSDSGKPPRVVLKFDETTNVHYGGSLQFGPDGFLYIGMGDSGPQGDPEGHGQNTGLFLGKLLRIDVGASTDSHPYSVPDSNPFAGRTGFLPEIWAYGFREPWRFSFDRLNGDLWVGDVGQDRYEEVDLVQGGENYGWNVYEGFEPFSNKYRRPDEHFTPPVFAYSRRFGPSVTGGFVYRGDPNSSFYGVYIFGDYQTKRLFGLTQRHRRLETVRQLGTAPEPVVSFGQDASGNLYVVGYDGMIFKMNFNRSHFE